MLKTLVKVAEVVAASAALAFVVLLFFNGDNPEEVQAAPAEEFPEEAAAAIEAKARSAGQAGGEATTTTAGDDGEPTTTAPDDDNGVDGAAVFADNCAQCHGNDGGGGVGPNLQDLDDADTVAGVVTNGRGGMPSFEGRLDPDEIDAVADYVANEL
jgi:cytochrome c551